MAKKTERDLFEAEHKRQFPYCGVLVRSSGHQRGYDDYDIHNRWIGWTLARSSVKRTAKNRRDVAK